MWWYSPRENISNKDIDPDDNKLGITFENEVSELSLSGLPFLKENTFIVTATIDTAPYLSRYPDTYGVTLPDTISVKENKEEQKKNISIMMSLGYTKSGVSLILLIQTLLHILIGLIFGIPVGILSSKLAVRLTSNATETFPFINLATNYFIAIGLILAFILVSYLVALYKMKKWNLAENTKSRE